MKHQKKSDKKTSSYFAETIDHVGEIAIQYGFTAIKPPAITNAVSAKAKQLRDYDIRQDTDEKVALFEWYMAENMQNQPQPLLFFFKNPLPGAIHKKKPSEESYGLEIIGSGRSTGEALIIKTTLAILSDLGYKDVCVDINSIGDRESISRFDRELSTYIRKHANEIPAKLRDALRKNPYIALTSESLEIGDIPASFPQSVATLSEPARAHFKEVLEYLEAFDVPYKIKPTILSNKLFAAFTCFEIRELQNKKSGEEGALLAYGYRYNHLGRKLGAKRDIPSVGATITVKKNDVPKKKIIVSKIKKPRFYLIQLGNTAKLKALNVIELLRKNKISVYHSLTKDKIVGQLSGADYTHASHVLIIGQKEAIENTVVVRDCATREQETVPVDKLTEFLKKLEK